MGKTIPVFQFITFTQENAFPNIHDVFRTEKEAIEALLTHVASFFEIEGKPLPRRKDIKEELKSNGGFRGGDVCFSVRKVEIPATFFFKETNRCINRRGIEIWATVILKGSALSNLCRVEKIEGARALIMDMDTNEKDWSNLEDLIVV